LKDVQRQARSGFLVSSNSRRTVEVRFGGRPLIPKAGAS
jgi:hypothetical protein